MANSYTTQDVNQILNNPGIFYFKKKGSAGEYIKSVFTNGASFSYSPELFTQAFDDTGDVYDVIASESGEISFSFGKPFDFDFMSALSGGLFTKTTATAGAQVVVNQVIAADWTNKEPMVLNLVDSAGKFYQADGAPAITSVTAETTGALAVNDDYTIVPSVNSFSGYAIVINTAGTAEVGTDEAITIVYNSPTVLGGSTMGVGGIKNYDPIEGYFDTFLKDGTPAQVYFYKGYYNGNLNMTFGTENSPEAAVTDVTISLKLDTSRPAGSQLVDLHKGSTTV
jgi:hypothetical protein